MIVCTYHGGGHGGWCWEHVVPMLVAQGHRALTPDLPGSSSIAARDAHGLSLPGGVCNRYGSFAIFIDS